MEIAQDATRHPPLKQESKKNQEHHVQAQQRKIYAQTQQQKVKNGEQEAIKIANLQKELLHVKKSMIENIMATKIQQEKNKLLIQQLRLAGYDAVPEAPARSPEVSTGDYEKKRDKRIAVVGYSCI